MNRKRVYFLFAGASMGHIKPALILKDRLQEKNASVYLFTDSRPLTLEFDNVVLITISRKKAPCIFQIFGIFLRIIILALIKKPCCFIGFGGRHSIPGVLAGKALRKKTFIYEPNAMPGRANKLLSLFVDYIFIIWEETRNHFSLKEKNKITRIKPLISEKAVSVKSKKFSVLFLGGSQGSIFMNRVFIDLIKNAKHKFKDINFTVITGKSFYRFVKESIFKEESNIKIFAYKNDLTQLYASSDLIVSRSGAQTILEVVLYNLAAVFVPYPYASKHQLKNAEIINKKNACYIYEQALFNWEVCAKLIAKIQSTPALLNEIKNNLENIKDFLTAGLDAETVLEDKFE